LIGIYEIKNKISGKFYVGSSVDIQKRWDNHKYCLRRGIHVNCHLQNSWIKHGENSFSFRVIEKVIHSDDLLKREQYWFDTLDPMSNGYNLNPIAGSGSGNGEWWDRMSEEDKFHHSEMVSERMKKKHGNQSDGNRWDDESGAGDRWLRANDPNYGDRKKVNYLTPRQYRYRAAEKELLTDPMLIDSMEY
jgi:group I intron endonuclease